MSYRWSFFGAVGGVLVMSCWLWIMGTPLWVAFVFVVLALLIFLGLTRIVAEAGLAAVRAPMTAPDLVILGLGTDLVTRTGVWNLSLAYMWGADVRVFVMATCTNALKLIEEMEPTAAAAGVLGYYSRALHRCSRCVLDDFPHGLSARRREPQ